MRNENILGVKARDPLVFGATDHPYFFLNFSEGGGGTLSDKSGSLVDFPLTGATPAWATPAAGIDVPAATLLALWSGDANATPAQIERSASIYPVDASNRLNGIYYVMFKMAIAAAPASDTSNIIYAAGREGTGIEQYGQHYIRLRASRSPELALRRRGQSGSYNYSNANAALVAGGAARSYLLLVSEANDTDLSVEWFVDGGDAPNSSVQITDGLSEFTVRSDEAGMEFFARTSSAPALGTASALGSGTVAPVVDWMGCGKMGANAANRMNLISAWQGLHRSGVMPLSFGRISA